MTTKERPILFSGAMVRAILDGRKTQTRRVVKPRKDRFTGCELAANELAGEVNAGDYTNSPYEPGDRLWVRESFWGCDGAGMGDTPCVVYDDEWHGKEYRAAEIRPWAPKFGRIPSIHMPRNCSRITLEITGLRVEKLNDCSEVDAAAEGVLPYAIYGGKVASWKGSDQTPAARELAAEAYRDLWNQINGPDAWDANPWVWVVEFRRAS